MDHGQTQLWVRVPGAEEQLRSLMSWLRHEDGLRGCVRLHQVPVATGEMGGVMDALSVAVGSGGMGAVLANCLSTWISQRRADVRITVSAEDGRTVEVDAKGVDPKTLAQEVEQLLSRPKLEAADGEQP